MKELYQKFLLLSRGKQITIVVCTLHLLTVFSLFGHQLLSRRLKPFKPMVVRTIAPPKLAQTTQPVQPTPIQPAPPIQPKPVQPPEPVQPNKKPSPTKPKQAPKNEPKKPSPSQANPPQDKKILKDISKSLETLSAETKKSRTTLNVPAKVSAKAQLTSQSLENPSYGEFLIGYLQNALDLPEFGEVKAKIEIDRFGKLVGLQILDAKSHKNAEFLKNQLPDLLFPCLTDFGILDSTQTFTITFRNVEIR